MRTICFYECFLFNISLQATSDFSLSDNNSSSLPEETGSKAHIFSTSWCWKLTQINHLTSLQDASPYFSPFLFVNPMDSDFFFFFPLNWYSQIKFNLVFFNNNIQLPFRFSSVLLSIPVFKGISIFWVNINFESVCMTKHSETELQT